MKLQIAWLISVYCEPKVLLHTKTFLSLTDDSLLLFIEIRNLNFVHF